MVASPSEGAVFPAHAGMSPRLVWICPPRCGFPRSRGDEPGILEAEAQLRQFSPLTRG